MSSESTPCPQCSSELPADAPQGLCPRCLAALNFATETMLPEAMPAAPQAPLTPAELAPHFPQLEIIQCLGRGGMGVVYKARQKTLNRLVALKLLAPERADDAKFAARFEKEAQALAALSHPHIVTIHDFGQAGGFFFLLMEFVDGVNLRQAMAAGRFTPEQALAIVPPVCEALQYAHEHGIVHRDIKPENLLLDKTGRLKIADFGIAKMIGAAGEKDGGSLSQPLGTPAYAAPEQKDESRQVDHRADIYSLGVVLYELLTGELPKGKFEPPSRHVHIDVRLDEIVLRALETQPELRFATAAEFRTQLAGAVVAKPEKPEVGTTRTTSPQPRRWLALGLGLSMVFAAVLGVLFILRQDTSPISTSDASGRVFIMSEHSGTASSFYVQWTMSAAKASEVRIQYANVTQSSRLQWNEASKDYEVKARIEITRLKDGLVRLHTQIGDSEKTRELTGNFTQLQNELLTTGLISAKASTDTSIGICQLQGRPVTLELLAPSSPEVAVQPPADPLPAPTAWESRLQAELQLYQLQVAKLSETLGRNHPQMKSLREQITMLEKQIEQARQKPVILLPKIVQDDPRFITTPGRTMQLNLRYTLNVALAPLRGKDGTSTMRSYTLEDKHRDGAEGVTTFAPLSIENERFIIFWDREKNELWLASPSIIRRHILPENGLSEERVYMQPDIPDFLEKRMPKPFREAIASWYFHGDEADASPPAALDGDLSDFLKTPQLGGVTLVASLSRVHYFEKGGPDGFEWECFRIKADKTEANVFLQSKTLLSVRLHTLLPWGPPKQFRVGLKWALQGAQSWLQLVEAEPF